MGEREKKSRRLAVCHGEKFAKKAEKKPEGARTSLPGGATTWLGIEKTGGSLWEKSKNRS